MSVLAPAYEVRFYSGSTLKHGFGYGWPNKVLSLRIKPGLTSAIGSFEILLPDTGSDGESFNNILPYEDVWIWYGYGYQGWYNFKGKIDSINVNFSEGEGYTRTYNGRDYGEALFRTLVRRAWVSSIDTAEKVVINLKDLAGLDSSDVYIETSYNIYPLVLDNESCFRGIEEISNQDNQDFYVGINKKLHWFPRQSKSGTETFSVGSNIFNYRVFRDIMDIKNQYYVFGMRDTAGMTGSDLPVNHDDWTESNTTNWSAYISATGVANNCNIEVQNVNTNIATGSHSLAAWTGSAPGNRTYTMYIRKEIPEGPVACNSGDILHFYTGLQTAFQTNTSFKVCLMGDADNYFESQLETQYEWWGSNYNGFREYTINLGPEYEGISTTGSRDTTTGSYKWTRVGNPDWYNINYIQIKTNFYTSESSISPSIFIDGLYIGTRFQFQTGSVGSQTAYGFRPKPVINDKYNSKQYCKNIATTLLATNKDLTTQIEILTSGSPNLTMGYKYQLTIPAENISSEYYELIDLEHRFYGDGFTSRCIFTDKPQLRTLIPIIDYPVQEVQRIRKLFSGPFLSAG